jgi:GNAT superfamily N-acetyltransferase
MDTAKKPITVRRFCPSDADTLSKIITRCLREVNSKDYPASLIEKMCTHFTPDTIRSLAEQREMYVAELDGETVGTVSRHENKVYTMFVNPDCAGSGVGSRLMGHIEGLAAGEGYDFMETGASITAHDFYRKRGYVDVRESETEFGLNYILRKPL